MFDFSPAHLHVALNHIPIIGLAVASFPIVIGIVAQCRTTIATGLLATLLCAALMPAIMQTGGKAADAFDHGTIQSSLDDAGKNALNVHANRAETTTPVVYASALLAILALLALIKFKTAATWLSFAVILGNTAAILLGMWTAEAGGMIRHLEFRSKAPWQEPAQNNNPTISPLVTPITPPIATPAIQETITPTSTDHK